MPKTIVTARLEDQWNYKLTRFFFLKNPTHANLRQTSKRESYFCYDHPYCDTCRSSFRTSWCWSSTVRSKIKPILWVSEAKLKQAKNIAAFAELSFCSFENLFGKSVRVTTITFASETFNMDFRETRWQPPSYLTYIENSPQRFTFPNKHWIKLPLRPEA